MRSVLILLATVIGLAILRNLVREVGRFAARTLGKTAKSNASSGSGSRVRSGGRLARDPHTGTYVDPRHAVRATVNGTQHFFESEASRDAYRNANA